MALNNPDIPVRPGGAEGPIYPRISRAEGDFFETEDPWTFIESITWPDSDAPDAPEIIYVQFPRPGQRARRWKKWGDCYSCGIADFDGFKEDGTPDFGNYKIELVPRKQIGEKYSVIDRDYGTRKDYPCTPDYPRMGRNQAAEMGIPYVCGLKFEELSWIY